jgi:hypothetical protein
MWFRYYLKNHIADQLSELEVSDGLLQMDNAPSDRAGENRNGVVSGETIQANSDGNCLNSTGKFRFMADRQLMDMPLDVSTMSLDWVAETTDKLFKDLSVAQRTILYLYY